MGDGREGLRVGYLGWVPGVGSLPGEGSWGGVTGGLVPGGWVPIGRYLGFVGTYVYTNRQTYTQVDR